MITIEELSAYNRKLVDENLKLRKENENLKKRNSDEECLKRFAKKGYIKFCAKDNEWHKVADGDLPKRNNELTDRSDVVITDKGIAHYNFRKQKWYVHNFEWGMSFPETIIAWCEIPQYTEE